MMRPSANPGVSKKFRLSDHLRFPVPPQGDCDIDASTGLSFRFENCWGDDMRPKRPLDAMSRDGRSFYARLALGASSLVLLTACEQNSFVPPPPPKVEVASPVQKPV